MCKSGRKTELTCGTIQAKNVSVTYAEENPPTTVNGLVRHSACSGKGDSGGTHQSYYYPVATSLPFYEFVYGVELWE